MYLNSRYVLYKYASKISQRDNNTTGMKMSSQGFPLVISETRGYPGTTGQAAADQKTSV